ncbi:MAG: Gfo/Idh/MocA family oxidoreductase [Clostridia bacterium]|nr:Gfo/Idh/MocA family oxidoreductase [Clostridia bacterium]
MYKVCVIGCGGIAQVHVAALTAMEGVTLSACCDIVPERAQAYAEKFRCTPYTDYETLLEKEKPDAVHLCTPHYLHTPMAEAAAERGIHVFTEKPPVISRDEWARLQKAAEKVNVGVCLQNRYNPNVKKAQEILSSGEMGKVKGVRATVFWDRGPAYYATGDWRGKWETAGGGAIANQTVHTLDLLLRFLGKPDKILCHMANRHLPGLVEVEGTVEGYFESEGKRGIYFATNAWCDNTPVMIEIAAEKGTLRIDGDDLFITRDGQTEKLPFDMPTPVGKSYWGSGHFACIEDYYRCLEQGKPFRNNMDGIRTVIETMLTMYEQGRKEMQ